MPYELQYAAAEWKESAGHFPLKDCSEEEFVLLHRHWMWAHQQYQAFEHELQAAEPIGDDGMALMATKGFGFMVVWYGMLWSIIEACTVERRLPIRGHFRVDIDGIAPKLKPFRNAILHDPHTNKYLDSRIDALMAVENAATTIRRIHSSFGRMFLDEANRRRVVRQST